MRPLDPRLLRHARATRGYLTASVALGVGQTALVIAQALLLAAVISAGFQHHASLGSLRPQLLALLAVVVARSALAWGWEVAGNRASAQAKGQLRGGLLRHAMALGPGWLAGARTGELTTLSTRGLDALDPYFAKYLPQLVLACIVPVAVVVVVGDLDLTSAVIIAVTVPLVPLFLAVVGISTRNRVDRQWRTLAVLSGHFLDVVSGLATLRLFGRAEAAERSVADVGDRYRRSTMGVLRVSFVSSLVLELVATLSVALVAVSLGLRLLDGRIGLQTALAVLLLTPEAYLPVRLVGQQYHAAAEGVGAAGRVFEVLETELPVHGGRLDVPDLNTATIVVDALTVTYPGRDVPALAGLTCRFPPGTVTAVVGPSGAGKSTLLAVLMRFVTTGDGSVRLEPRRGPDTELADLDPDAWRSQVAFLPQRPYLPAGTVAAAVRLGAPDATDEQVRRALADAGLDLADPYVAATLPAGLDTVVDAQGGGLSAGQRRRIALARALVRDAPIVLLDEPTSALDGSTEVVVVEAVRALRAHGRTVVVVAHRPAVVTVADRVLRLAAPAGRQGTDHPATGTRDDAAVAAVAAAAGVRHATDGDGNGDRQHRAGSAAEGGPRSDESASSDRDTQPAGRIGEQQAVSSGDGQPDPVAAVSGVDP